MHGVVSGMGGVALVYVSEGGIGINGEGRSKV